MIIKKWNASNTVWENQAPATTASQIFTSNNFATSVFDGNNKIKPAHLPNSVFDSLFIYGSIGTNSDIRNLGIEAVDEANTIGRSAVGFYWVVTTACTISSGTGAITIGGITATTSGINPSEEGNASATSAVLEVGDWFIITKITGLGTTGSPYAFTFAVVNNTYELASATASGIVKLGSSTGNTATAAALGGTNGRTYLTQLNASQQLVVNVPWENTVFTHPTQATIDVNATDNGINVIDRVQVNNLGHVTSVSARNLSNATTSAAGVMSAADKTKLDGIAAGAQVNVGTNIAQGTRTTTTVPITSSTGSNATLQVATTALAGVMSSADKTKLDGIATGATDNVGTVTSVAGSGGTGISVTGGPITTSGTLTITNTAPNANHTGDVTGATALTIANNAVVTAKINNGAVSLAKMANLAANSIIGNNTASSATPIALDRPAMRALAQTKQFFSQTAEPTVSNSGSLDANAIWLDIN
jgi:hypothetical protein